MNEFLVNGPVAVDIRLPAGSCEISAEEGGSRVHVLTEPYDAGDSRDRKATGSTEISFERGRLQVRAPAMKGVGRVVGRRSAAVALVVTVPEGSTVSVATESAAVVVHGRVAALKVNSADGDVAAAYVTGNVSVNSSDSDVRIGRVDGKLDVDSASGTVEVGYAGQDVAVKSSSGSTAIGTSYGNVKVSTASGDLTINSAHQGTVRYNSSSGNLTVGVPHGTDVTTNFKSGDEHSVAASVLAAAAEARRSGVKTSNLSIKVSTASGRVAVTEATA